MASLKTKDIKSNLCKKGFELDPNNHNKLNYRPDGKKTRIRTLYSHGKSEVGDSLIGMMARQTRLSISDFKRLVECTLSKEEYYDKVKDIV